MAKRALAEQRKHEAERLEAALGDQQRQLMRRGARPLSLLDRFLQTKWGDLFTVSGWQLGGTGDAPPARARRVSRGRACATRALVMRWARARP